MTNECASCGRDKDEGDRLRSIIAGLERELAEARRAAEPGGDVVINPALMGWKYFGPEGTEITAEEFANRVKHGDRIEVRVGPNGFDAAWFPENRGDERGR